MWLVVVDGGWSRFSACSTACSGGTHSRTCSNPAPANGGKDCVGAAWALCNMQACAGTTKWLRSTRHTLNNTLESMGIGVQRMFSRVVPLLGNSGQVLLTHLTCRVTGGITRDSTLDGGWSGFGACSVACGGGTQSRICNEPARANGGKDCAGNATKACNTQACAGTGCWR